MHSSLHRLVRVAPPNAALHLRRGHRPGPQPPPPTPRRQVQALVRRASGHGLPCGIPLPPWRVGRAPEEVTRLPGTAGRSGVCDLECLLSWVLAIVGLVGHAMRVMY